MNNDLVILLGVRGSCPVQGKEFSRYGGATSCIFLRLGGELIILDGGTGLLNITNYLDKDERQLHILLSHPHFDHLIGLPICPVFFDPSFHIHLYAAQNAGLGVKEQVLRLMSPPLWPVGFEAFQASMEFHDLSGKPFQIGNVSIGMTEGKHPGGNKIFRLHYGEKSVVYASDFECEQESEERLTSFAQGCSLLICDAQYSDEEIEKKRGFGHTAWDAAVQIGQNSGAKRVVMFHHDPFRTDDELDQAEEKLKRNHPHYSFARCGEEIYL